MFNFLMNIFNAIKQRVERSSGYFSENATVKEKTCQTCHESLFKTIPVNRGV